MAPRPEAAEFVRTEEAERRDGTPGAGDVRVVVVPETPVLQADLLPEVSTARTQK